MIQQIEKTVSINAPPEIVWNALTDPTIMNQWMADPEVELDIQTDWIVGNPIVIKGFLHASFENIGKILQFEPMTVLRYSHFSSLSRLPNTPENYSIIEFRVTHKLEQTLLTVKVSGFPTEVIFKHLNFYWPVAISILKEFIEKSLS